MRRSRSTYQFRTWTGRSTLHHRPSGRLLARILHHNGARAAGPFIGVNCTALPRELFESELFGFERGAFTGAVQRKIGLLEKAEGGSLFLDEIGDLDLTLQAKLLRVIQERTIRRLGERMISPWISGSSPQPIATSKNRWPTGAFGKISISA